MNNPDRNPRHFRLTRPWILGVSLLEIIIISTGIGVSVFLYQFTTGLKAISQAGSSFEKNIQQMMFSTSLAYIQFSQILEGDETKDLEEDVLSSFDDAIQSCSLITGSGPEGRFSPTKIPQAAPDQEPPRMCDMLTRLRELTERRWEDHYTGKADTDRAEYEDLFVDFLKAARPLDGAAATDIINAEINLQRSILVFSFSTGSVFLLIAVITWRTRRRNEKHLKQIMDENEQRSQLNTALASERTLLATLIQNLPDAIFAKDRQNRFLIANRAATQKTGLANPENMIGLTEADFLPADVAAQHTAEEQAIYQTGQPLIDQQESFDKGPSGEKQWRLTTKVPLRDAQGQIYGLVGISRDISEQRAAEEALQIANEKLIEGIAVLERRNQELDLLTDMIDLLQACPSIEEACLVVSERMQKIFPQDAGTLYLFKNSRNVLEQAANWGEEFSDQPVIKPNECWGLRRGRIHTVKNDKFAAQGSSEKTALVCRHVLPNVPSDYLCLPLVAQGETLGMLHLRRRGDADLAGAPSGEWFDSAKKQCVNMVGDSLALAMANLKLSASLRQQSIRDPLTGLFNRRYMEETLERELMRAKRSGKPIGIMMVDIDHFKSFNDTFGHQAGDALLVDLGRFLQSRVRGEDVACRYGGEEFFIMLPESDRQATSERAEELCRGVRQMNVQYMGQALGKVTISLGLSMFPEHGETGESLIQSADRALYRAKLEGRNRVIIG